MSRHSIATSRIRGRMVVALLALFALASLQTGWVAQAAPSYAAPLSPQTGNWEQQAPYPTHFAISGVDMVTPTEAWAVAYTDILHTTDSGVTWEKQPRPGADNLYAVDFYDNQHGIAMGNTVLYTRNGGSTWSQGVGAFGYDVEMADANLAFITDHRAAGYMRSTDGGATWAFRTMPSNITTIQCFDSLNCVAASPSGTYHSYDAGLNWTFVAGQGDEFASTYFINHNQGWIVRGNSASRTTDGGATWQAQTLPGGSWIYDMMFVDANIGWGVGDNMVRTTDGGATWQQVPLPPESLPLWDVDFVDAQHGIAGGDSFLNTDSVIITSNDGGATWATSTNGSINDVLDMVALDRDHAWTSHDYGGKTSRTTDGGRTWRVAEVGGQYVVLTGIDMADTLHGWTVGYDTTFLEGRIYHTNDGGASWQQQFDWGADYLQGVDALDAQTAIIVGGYSATGSIRHRTTDGGNTWQVLNNVPIGAFFYDVFFLNSQTGWMVGGNGGDIVKSTDGGNTWVIQHTPAQYTLASIHFSDANNGWAGGYYGTLIHTTNGGATWTLQNPQIPEYTHVLDVSSTSPTHGWISGYGGGAQSRPFVKYTTDGGATWIEHTPLVGPYDSFAAIAFLDDDYGWAAGAGGIFRHTPSGYVSPTPTPTATEQAIQTRTPTRTYTPTQIATPTTSPVPPTLTGTPANTGTVTPTQSTTTLTPIDTQTPVPAATNTPMGTHTAISTPAPATLTPGPCVMTFTDVHATDYFYSGVQYLACHGAISGYSDGTFRPFNNTTRGQLTKIVVLAQGWAVYTPPAPTFSDVPATDPFYGFVETAHQRQVITGYSDGTFRPANQVTRGQITKIVALAEAWTLIDPPLPTFTDVPAGSPFYSYIETAYSRQIISGYADGTFRPGNNATRGQVARIIYNALISRP